VIEQYLRDTTENADQLRSRARKLRAEAELNSDVRGLRDAALALAGRYERAADARPARELHPWPELPEAQLALTENIEQALLQPTESKAQLLALVRHFRTRAEQTDDPRKREIALALADRYECAAGGKG
jgi:hypothetical protein